MLYISIALSPLATGLLGWTPVTLKASCRRAGIKSYTGKHNKQAGATKNRDIVIWHEPDASHVTRCYSDIRLACSPASPGLKDQVYCFKAT